jgi:hypothetical protein
MEQSAVAGQFVEGLDYPVAKADVVRLAEEQGLADEIVVSLRDLPEREFADRDDLTAALNAV